MATKKPTKRVKAGSSKASAADKRKAFVEAFLSNGGNATQAAISAGFSPHTASRQGGRLLKHVLVAAELDKRRTEIVANLELNTEKTLREVSRLSFSDPRKLMNEDGTIKLPHQLDADTAAAIASFKWTIDGGIEYKFWDKNSALEKAVKVQGLYQKDNEQQKPELVGIVQLVPLTPADGE